MTGAITLTRPGHTAAELGTRAASRDGARVRRLLALALTLQPHTVTCNRGKVA